MMQIKDVTKILKKLGWILYRDDINNHYACYDLSDRFVDIGYEVKYGWKDRKLILEANLTTPLYFLA